jgi:serine/threonine protein phosphatase 1
VVFLGDMVSKGPHSQKVVKLAQKINASCVIGNQDYQLLDLMGYMQAEDNFLRQPVKEGELVYLEEDEETIPGRFREKAAQWLLQCPLILHIGDILDGQEFVAVHAGLYPGTELAKQGIPSHLKTDVLRSLGNHEYSKYPREKRDKRDE